MKEIKYTILYCVFVRTFVIPFYYGSGNVISYGSGSGSTTLATSLLDFEKGRCEHQIVKLGWSNLLAS